MQSFPLLYYYYWKACMPQTRHRAPRLSGPAAVYCAPCPGAAPAEGRRRPRNRARRGAAIPVVLVGLLLPWHRLPTTIGESRREQPFRAV